jgi:hypothetical protein
MKKLIVFLVLVMSFVPVFTAYASTDNAVTSTLTRYVRDDGIVFELVNWDGKIGMEIQRHSSMVIGFYRSPQVSIEQINNSLRMSGIAPIDVGLYEWFQGRGSLPQSRQLTEPSPEAIAFQTIRPINEFPQFLNDNPATLPTNHVLNNIARDWARQASAHPIPMINLTRNAPSQIHIDQSNELIRKMNENRHLDPASRALHLNNEGMNSLLKNIDGIFPFATEDGVTGFWNGREIWVATHVQENGKIVPRPIDDIAYTVFYEIGRTLGFGVGLSSAKAQHFTNSGAPGGHGRVPIFHDLPKGLHIAFANSFNNEMMTAFLSSQRLSVQDREFLAIFYEEIILDGNVPRFNTAMPELGIRSQSVHYSFALGFESLPQQNEKETDSHHQPQAAVVSNTEIRLAIDNKNYTVNGVLMESDAAPFIAHGRTMIPLRIISEALGASVSFNSATGTVTIIHKGAQISLLIDTPLPNDMGTPVVINGRTFVPIRYVSETLGAAVRWDNTNSAVYIRHLL